MKSLIKKIFKTRLLLKVLAIIYAYLLWVIISQSLTSSIKINIPIVLYNEPKNINIKSTDSIDLYIKGKRHDIRNFLSQSPTVTIDAEKFSNEGNHKYPILQEHIFLPEEIKLLNYKPSQLDVYVIQK